MEMFVGVLALLAGAVCVIAGVKGRGSELFQTVTGMGVGGIPVPIPGTKTANVGSATPALAPVHAAVTSGITTGI